MPETVEERLLTEVTERLDRVSIANGYDFNASTIRTTRGNLVGQTLAPRTYRIVDGGVSDAPTYDRPGNPPCRGKMLTVFVECIGSSSDGDPNPEQYDVALMMASAELAITNPPIDPIMWQTFGGLAIDCDIGNADPMDSPEARVTGRTVTLNIWYRTDETNPFQARP